MGPPGRAARNRLEAEYEWVKPLIHFVPSMSLLLKGFETFSKMDRSAPSGSGFTVGCL